MQQHPCPSNKQYLIRRQAYYSVRNENHCVYRDETL